MVRRCLLGVYAGPRASVAFSHIRYRGFATSNRPTRTNFIATTNTFDYSDFGLLSVSVLFSCAYAGLLPRQWLSARQVQCGFLLFLLLLFCYDFQFQRPGRLFEMKIFVGCCNYNVHVDSFLVLAKSYQTANTLLNMGPMS